MQLRYDAPGDPDLAQRVVDLLKQGGFPKAKKDERRGLDHGAWVPLLMMYPQRDVPVVQLSVQYRKDGAHHYKVGQALTSLKNEGVLVIGSGSATHNLGSMNFDGGPVAPWALAFDNWLNDALCTNKLVPRNLSNCFESRFRQDFPLLKLHCSIFKHVWSIPFVLTLFPSIFNI